MFVQWAGLLHLHFVGIAINNKRGIDLGLDRRESLSKSCDLDEDRVCCRDPEESFRVPVLSIDIFLDIGD